MTYNQLTGHISELKGGIAQYMKLKVLRQLPERKMGNKACNKLTSHLLAPSFKGPFTRRRYWVITSFVVEVDCGFTKCMFFFFNLWEEHYLQCMSVCNIKPWGQIRLGSRDLTQWANDQRSWISFSQDKRWLEKWEMIF